MVHINCDRGGTTLCQCMYMRMKIEQKKFWLETQQKEIRESDIIARIQNVKQECFCGIQRGKQVIL